MNDYIRVENVLIRRSPSGSLIGIDLELTAHEMAACTTWLWPHCDSVQSLFTDYKV